MVVLRVVRSSMVVRRNRSLARLNHLILLLIILMPLLLRSVMVVVVAAMESVSVLVLYSSSHRLLLQSFNNSMEALRITSVLLSSRRALTGRHFGCLPEVRSRSSLR